MKIAVVGAGVSGLLAARRLTAQGHDVSVFEAGDRCGGHAQTVSLESSGIPGKIEAGFLVFNSPACPRLSALLRELDMPTQDIRVAYEIGDPQSGRGLRGGSLGNLPDEPLWLFRPSMYRFVADWVRFSSKLRKLLQSQHRRPPTTLGRFLSRGFYSHGFAERFVYPLAAAVNPAGRQKLAEMPLEILIGFIQNQGLLKLAGQLNCKTLQGSSREYVRRLADPLAGRIHLNCPISAIARNDNYVLLKFPHRSRERFEQLVLAVHADVAFRLLADPTRHERQVLQSFDYAPQTVYLHRDDRRQKPPPARATWRFQPSASSPRGMALSYCISEVQHVDAPDSLRLTVLGADHTPPSHVLRSIQFRRPVFSGKSLLAQRRFADINGRRRTYFCGSYWGRGLHEDAVRSAEQVAQRMRHASYDHVKSRRAGST